MIKQSENNTYSKGISYLSKWLDVSRTTFYKKHLLILIKNKHIIRDCNNKKTFHLNPDIKERLEQENTKFTIIYRSWKSLGVQSISQYIFYYTVFSLSRKREYANANKYYYAEILKIKPKTIFTFIKEDFIVKITNTDFMKLTPKKEKWFLERQDVQFLENKNKCTVLKE